MKLKPKGRKIYRQKTHFERLKTFKDNTAAVITTVLLVAVLVFVGYSVGAPVMRFLQEKHILEKPSVPDGEDTAAPAAVTPAVPATEETTELETEPPIEVPEMHGYLLGISDMTSEEKLQEALELVPKQTTHILVPLKASGGGLYYATEAGKGTAVQAAVPLARIYEIVESTGATPVAELNLLEDSLYPLTIPETGYHFADGSGWLDGSTGLPSLSPFSTLTTEYLTSLASEAELAGFTEIVCEGLTFPQFSERDLERLDERCSASDRYTVLVELVEAMQRSAPDAVFYVKMDSESILHDQTAALSAADHLELKAVLVTVSEETAGSADVLRQASKVHPCILEWNGAEMPLGEENYILTARTVQED